MAIDTAQRRRSISGIPLLLPGVTPNATPDAAWRQEAGWSYSGILAAGPATDGIFRTHGILDNFNRSDSDDVGSDWQESDETGKGLEIVGNALHCREDAFGGSSGTMLHQTALIGDQIALEWRARCGTDSSDRNKMSIYARADSRSGVGTAYRLDIDSNAGAAVLNRLDGIPEGEGGLPDITVIATGLAVDLDTAYKTFRWEIDNESGQVVHRLYVNDALQETVNDTDVNRITSNVAYTGVFLSSDIPVTPAAFIVDVDYYAGWTRDFIALPRGRHINRNEFTAVPRGRHDLVITQIGPPRRLNPVIARGRHIGRRRFVDNARGRHVTFNSFTPELRGRFMFFAKIVTVARGRHKYQINISGPFARGKHRITNTAIELYELYHGVGAPPDFTAAPAETFSSLPHTTTLTLSVSNTHYLRVGLRNRFNLLTLEQKDTIITIDGSGNLVAVSPSDPHDTTIAPAASPAGAVRIKSFYDYETDGTTLAAVSWLVYLTSNGVDPDPDLDTPTVVTIAKVDGQAKLDWTSGGFADGLTIKALVRVRRVDAGPVNVDSTNTTIISTTSDTDGPAKPDFGAALFGAAGIDAVHQDRTP